MNKAIALTNIEAAELVDLLLEAADLAEFGTVPEDRFWVNTVRDWASIITNRIYE